MKKTCFILIVFMVACAGDNSDDVQVEISSDCNTEVSLEREVRPIIDRSCAISGCHLDTQSPMFSSKEAIISSANRIAARVTAGTMPPAGRLDEASVSAINCWVSNGAEDN